MLSSWRQEAVKMAPFSRAQGNAYPGLRRVFTNEDRHAMDMVDQLVAIAAPFIGGAFDVDRLDLLEASFSMVTTPPQDLSPKQRAPHFDEVNPNLFALILYLSDTPNTGTAFYRHRATGIEEVTATNLDHFVSIVRHEQEKAPAHFVNESNQNYEQIGFVEARPDRMTIYRGALLHSGIIPDDMCFSEDPTKGRLTLNLFIEAQ